VAARSYGLATLRSGPFDHYDDTRSQVYGGKGSETRATNRAVAATRHEVVKHNGRIATTYFFSTSGGRTENAEFGFVGSSPSPYLKSVNDPYDKLSPQHRWRVRLSNSQMEARLSGLFAGNLRRLDVTKRGRSPRIVRVRVVGSNGSTKITGPALQARLGTRSTWMRFDKR
jgi:stage II sporulation protein D